MMRQTGGSAVAATSTKSSPCERASWTASRVFMMPSCSPSAAMTRTCGTRILSLMRVAGGLRLSGRCPRPRNEGILTPPELGARGWGPGASQNLSLTSLQPLASGLRFHRQGALADEPQRHLPELPERHRADVSARALAHRHLALLHLA